MKVVGAYEKCRLYIEGKSREAKETERQVYPKEAYPCITISRETGAGAAYVSEKLIEFLQQYSDPKKCQWTFFDKKLIQKVIEDHNLPTQVSEYMKEDKYRHINSAVNELLGLQPAKWTLLHKTTETILQLARMGNVVIVGRAANIITAKLRNTFHVRLVAPLEIRTANMVKHYNMTEKEAADFIKKEDHARSSYVKSHFYKDSTDPALYHMIVNTGKLSYEETAEIIGKAVMTKFAEKFKKDLQKTAV